MAPAIPGVKLTPAAQAGPPPGGYRWAHLYWGAPVPPVDVGSMNHLIWDLLRQSPRDLLVGADLPGAFAAASRTACHAAYLPPPPKGGAGRGGRLGRLGALWRRLRGEPPVSPFLAQVAEVLKAAGCQRVLLWDAIKRLPELRRALPGCTIAYAQRHYDYPVTHAHYEACDYLITQTPGQTRLAFERLRYLAPFTVSIPNGVELDLFHPPAPGEKSALRAQLGLPSDRLVAIFPSKLATYKGSRYLERWLELAPPGIFFLVVGWLQKRLPAAHRDRLKALLEAGGHCLWATGVPRAKMPAYYRAADLCLMPALWREGFSMAACEALASGLPLVASRAGCYPEIVTDGVNGILCEQARLSQEVLGALGRLRDDPALLARMSRQARRYAELRLPRARVLANFQAFLEGDFEAIDAELGFPASAED